MNYKTTLLAGAAVLFAGQAIAADLTGALYTPNKGQLTSDTTLGYSRVQYKHNVWPEAVDAWTASEVLEYGITDAFAINVGIGNAFDTEGRYNNSHNHDYALGAKYTTALCDKTTLQVNAYFETYDLKSWFGHHNYVSANDGRWQKNIGGDIRLGYDLGNGLSAYGIYGLETSIDDRWDREGDLDQYAKFGLHKYTGKWALDGALRYEFTTEGKNTHEWWFDAEADYYVTSSVALGVYGAYFLDGSKDVDDIHRAYEAGLRVKVAF